MPPLKDEVRGLITPGKNTWFELAEAALFLALRPCAPDRPVGRISAQVYALVLEHMGAEIDQRGMFETEDEATVHALLAAGGAWLTAKGMFYPTFRTARILYFDDDRAALERGAGRKSGGSPRRLAKVRQQLDVTWGPLRSHVRKAH